MIGYDICGTKCAVCIGEEIAGELMKGFMLMAEFLHTLANNRNYIKM